MVASLVGKKHMEFRLRGVLEIIGGVALGAFCLWWYDARIAHGSGTIMGREILVGFGSGAVGLGLVVSGLFRVVRGSRGEG